jgi:hypothetical protein
MTAIDRNLVSCLDNAVCFGRELARAERALASGQRYVQDGAPEIERVMRCGCTDRAARTARSRQQHCCNDAVEQTLGQVEVGRKTSTAPFMQ